MSVLSRRPLARVLNMEFLLSNIVLSEELSSYTDCAREAQGTLETAAV